MTGEPESDWCYFCGGKLTPGLTTLPFVLDSIVIIIKQVPTEVCSQCSEAVMSSKVTQAVDKLLKQAQQSGYELSILTYKKEALVPA